MANETLAICWAKLGSVPEHALPWLYAVARKCLANRRRAATRRAGLAVRLRTRSARPEGRDPAERLAERDAILRAFVVSSSMVMTGSHPIRQQDRSEMWQYGDRSHRITATSQQDDSNGTPPHETIEYVKVGDVLRARMQDGEIQTTRATDGEEARQALQVESDFVAAFRRRYEAHALRDAGETTFAGRRARAYEVTDVASPSPGVPRPPATTETYYLDAETGDPLGSARTMALYEPKLTPEHKVVPSNVQSGEMRITEVVERLERLSLTPGKLTAPWAG